MTTETVSPAGFLDIHNFPAAWALAAELQIRAESILVEGAAALEAGRFSEWPEPINLGGWQTCGLKWQGKMLEGWPEFTAGRFAAVSEMVVNCGYSLMLPGASIAPHVGYTRDVLRLHLGLSVPGEGDCAIVVGGERREWTQAGVLFFDDTIEHHAFNLTDKPRLILLVDVLRARAGQ